VCLNVCAHQQKHLVIKLWQALYSHVDTKSLPCSARLPFEYLFLPYCFLLHTPHTLVLLHTYTHAQMYLQSQLLKEDEPTLVETLVRTMIQGVTSDVTTIRLLISLLS